MSGTEKQTNEAALYPVQDKNAVALAPSSESDISQDVISSIKEQALLRKLDRTLLPAVTLLYLLSFLDRSNGMALLPICTCVCTSHIISVANARVEGLVTDLHICMLPTDNFCLRLKLTMTHSRKRVPDRVDLVFYRLYPLRGRSCRSRSCLTI